jgi:hypothetical protein
MTLNIEYHYQFDCCEDHEGSAFLLRKLKAGEEFQCEVCGAIYTYSEK